MRRTSPLTDPGPGLAREERSVDGHDIIVIGASAGGLKAVSAVLGELPADLPAAILVVQHLAPDHESILPKLLNDVSDLPVSAPVDGETVVPGRVYVAVPDHHMLLRNGRVHILRGPQENRFGHPLTPSFGQRREPMAPGLSVSC
jgi:chemotaxis response regulator CheB